VENQTPKRPPSTIVSNIEAIARLEEESNRARTFADRISDAIAGFAGTLSFVAVHIAVFALWVVWNLGWLGLPRFDPYPFVFLTLLVSFEAVLMATFVLIKQNRMSARADERAHFDLQVNLLTERELTKALQLLDSMALRLGVDSDAEIRELEKVTAVDKLAEEIRERLPDP